LGSAARTFTRAIDAARDLRRHTKDERRRRLWQQQADSAEELRIHETNAVVAQAQYQRALANRDQARVNLERTRIRTPSTAG
jgi:hypothetical protein